jgi:putative membrane protein
VTLITYVVAAALLVIGGVSGVQTLNQLADKSSVLDVLAALVYGSIQWFAAAGVTSSLGHVTDEYLDGRFEWRFLNAPFYVLAIAVVLHGVSAYFLLDAVGISYLAITLTGGTLLGLGSTLAFAIAETRFGRAEPA